MISSDSIITIMLLLPLPLLLLLLVAVPTVRTIVFHLLLVR